MQPRYSILQIIPQFFLKFLIKISSASDINHDLNKITSWAFQGKMRFNPEPNRQANEVYFSKKSKSDGYALVYLNNIPVQLCQSQKHLGVMFDKQLNFNGHSSKKTKVCINPISTMKYLSRYLSRTSLLNFYFVFSSSFSLL